MGHTETKYGIKKSLCVGTCFVESSPKFHIFLSPNLRLNFAIHPENERTNKPPFEAKHPDYSHISAIHKRCRISMQNAVIMA